MWWCTYVMIAATRFQPGVIVPDPYSHGTLPQRKRWFQAGYKRGLVKDCDTFRARRF